MRHSFVPSQQTYDLYHRALRNDLHIYNVQSGGGLGGFLKKAFSKFIIPVGKSVLSKGYEIAKPELQKIAHKGIESAAQYGVQKINSYANRAQSRVGNKRKNRSTPYSATGMRVKRTKRKDTLS